jgi:predicted ATP-dependent endonuclease of OLD family
MTVAEERGIRACERDSRWGGSTGGICDLVPSKIHHMRYKGFTIKNFKGIRELELAVEGKAPNSPLITLVGLNESGKSTILEALSFFYDNVVKGEKEQVTLAKSIVNDLHELIPKAKFDNFNGTIELSGQLIVEPDDEQWLKTYLDKNSSYVLSMPAGTTMSFSVVLNFKGSKYQHKSNHWSESIQVKIKGPGKRVPHKLFSIDKDLWNKVYFEMKKRIPPIIYYPDFLFEFPNRIYLEDDPSDTKEQLFYRSVLQDVLDSLQNDLTIKQHIVDRSKSDKYEDKESLKLVLNRMGGKITEFVTSDSISVFSNVMKRKRIIVSSAVDDSSKRVYCEIRLEDNYVQYLIRERSLGFRWFFIYLLFTRFRVYRDKKGILFLFDEPASNLHQTSQQKLLVALEELAASGSSTVVYSTHSHHLINPRWLESTYVVKNAAITYGSESEFDAKEVDTDISIERYRSFVGAHPNQTHYFKPILELLEYRPSELEMVPNAVFCEGKSDYYLLNYFQKVLDVNAPTIALMPGAGAGSLDSLIRLYLGWGRRFIVLLDADDEGQAQKERYVEMFGLEVEARIFSFGDIRPEWQGKGLEKLVGVDDCLKLQKACVEGETYHKRKFQLAVQELLQSRKSIAMTEAGVGALREVHTFLGNSLLKD